MNDVEKWQEYWNNYLLNKYGKVEADTEDDLFFQVARTLHKKPIEQQVFREIVNKIIHDLHLSPDDILVDFCCGNGLFTYELKGYVKQIIGVDFSQNIIDTAVKMKSADNISYSVGSAVDFLKGFKDNFPGVIPTRYLMNDSLAYFAPADLEEMLVHIAALSPDFLFVIRGVPNDDLKWNYYNTEERKAVYFANQAKGDKTNDGLGNWWHPGDISNIAGKLKLNCKIVNQQLPISDYRMDIFITAQNTPMP